MTELSGGNAVELRDNGTGGDEVAGDGVYSLLLRGANLEGHYCFEFRAEGTAVTGEAFTRSAVRTVSVRVAPAPENW